MNSDTKQEPEIKNTDSCYQVDTEPHSECKDHHDQEGLIA